MFSIFDDDGDIVGPCDGNGTVVVPAATDLTGENEAFRCICSQPGTELQQSCPLFVETTNIIITQTSKIPPKKFKLTKHQKSPKILPERAFLGTVTRNNLDGG